MNNPSGKGQAQGQGNKTKRSIFRRPFRLLCLLVAVLILLVAALFAALQTGPVRRMVVNRLAGALSTHTGWRLETGKTGGVWPFDMRLGDVKLSDAQGVWLSADDLKVKLPLWPGAGDTAAVDVGLSRARVARLPVMPPPSAQQPPPSPPGHPLAFMEHLKPLPVNVTARIGVDGLTLEKPVLGRELALSLQAAGASRSDKMTLDARMERLDGPSTRIDLALGISPHEGGPTPGQAPAKGKTEPKPGWASPARALRLDLALEEAPGGLVSELARLGPPFGNDALLSVKLAGAGPLNDWHANLSAAQSTDALLAGTIAADIDPADPLSADVDLAMPHLAKALAPFGVDLDASGHAHARFTGDIPKEDFSLVLDSTVEGLTPGQTPKWQNVAAALEGGGVTLNAAARLDPARVLTISHAALAAKPFTLDASGTYALATHEADLTSALAVKDLSLLSPLLGKPLAGELALASRMQGPVTAPSVSATLNGSRVAFETTRFDTVKTTVNVARKPDGSLQGDIAASAAREQASLNVNTRFAVAGDTLSLTELAVSGPGVQSSGNIDASLKAATATGRLAAQADLVRLGTFLQRPLSGAARLNLDMTADGPRQDAAITLTASEVKGFGLAVNKMDVSGKASDVTRAPAGTLTASVTGAKIGTNAVDALELKALGNGKETSLTLTGKGRLAAPFTADGAAVFTQTPEGGRVRLNRLQGAFSGVKIALTRTASVLFNKDSFSLADFALSVGTGKITASGDIKPGAAALSADLADFPLDILDALHVAQGISGMAQGKLRVSGEPKNPKLDATLTLSKVHEKSLADRKVPPAQLDFSAQYGANKVNVRTTIAAGEGVSLEARADVPARLSLMPFAFALPANAPLEAHLAGSADMAKLAVFSGQEDLRMKGTLTADLSARGRLDAPDFSGRIGIENGEMEYAATGTLFKNIKLDVDAQGKTVDLREFSASDAQSGTVFAQGRINLPFGAPFALDARITLDKAALVRMDAVDARLSGTVAVSGGPAGIMAKGNLSTGPVQLNIPQRVPPDAAPVPFTLINTPGRPPSAPKEAPGAPVLPVTLDLGIDFPGHIFVRGYGLDSVWDGQLHVSGSAAAPNVTGEITAVRGRLDFFSKPLTLAKGVISFTGGWPINPRLDIDTQYQGQDITAHILVTGDPRRLRVSLTSEPMLAQDEILSHILFGKGASSLSVPQALQLAQAAAALTGQGDAIDIMGKTRKLAGLDYLGVGSDQRKKGPDTGQMAITAGKYISDKVYVETSQGFGGKGPSVSVQVDVFPHVTIDSTMGVDAKTGAGVSWKLDY